METNNETIALNILCVPHNIEEIRHAYISKVNSTRENQVILLIIANGEKWHYLAVKKLSALFWKITSKHDGDFYCLNCLHSFRTENKLKGHENVCKNHDYCSIEMSEKCLKHNHGEKFMKTPFIIYVDMESLLEKIDTCIVILKIHQQLKQTNIQLLVIHYLRILYLMPQKTDMIIIEENSV